MKPILPIVALSLVTLAVLSGCTGTPAPQDTTPTTGAATTGTTAMSDTPNPYPIPSQTVTLSGSGATFPKPLLEEWGIEFSHKHSTVQISYAGGGSGRGISDITDKKVIFAGSDAPMQPSDVAKVASGNKILHIPETLGLVCMAYNVDGVSTQLKFTGDVVGRIYAGNITKWNDPQIVALNQGVTLPDKTITIVYRFDSSGTTFVFTDFLHKTSSGTSGSWDDVMGSSAPANKKPAWGNSHVDSSHQLAGDQNAGVGSYVKSTSNSIGYVELAYLRSMKLTGAAIKNAEGEYVTPTTDGASKAAAGKAGSLPSADGDWSQVSIVNATGAGAYPISSFTYILVYHDLADHGGKYSATEMNAFRAWLFWCLHEGQAASSGLGYAPLPSAVATKSTEALASITV